MPCTWPLRSAPASKAGALAGTMGHSLPTILHIFFSRTCRKKKCFVVEKRSEAVQKRPTSTVTMGKGTPAKAGTKRSKKQQRSILEDSDEDSDVPVRGRAVYEGERDDRIAENERVLGALVTRPLPMAEEIQAAKSSRKRCEPRRLHARSMLSTLLRRCRKAAAS